MEGLIGGTSRGFIPAAGRLVLRGTAAFYEGGVRVRNLAYDRGWIAVHRAAIPVVSLGNLTTGGTGKTPFAAFVARWFRDRGVRVCFLSRGYGSEPGQLNDEALVLEQLCPDVPHLQHPNRVASGRIAVEELGSQLLILDDGFQHRQLARNLDLVLIDATNPWGYGYLLPRGLLREPICGLRRASAAIITRVDQAPRHTVDAIRERIANVHPACDIVEVAFIAEQLVNASGQRADLESLRGKPADAFCGIGNPAAFRGNLESLGISVLGFQSYADHHRYSRADIENLQNWNSLHSSEAVLTTQKDLVKIGLDRLGNRPLWGVQIGTRIVAGAERLEQRLAMVLELVTPSTA